MAKSARGLQQKRATKNKHIRAAADREKSLAARKRAKQAGLTANDERRLNSEATAEAVTESLCSEEMVH